MIHQLSKAEEDAVLAAQVKVITHLLAWQRARTVQAEEELQFAVEALQTLTVELLEADRADPYVDIVTHTILSLVYSRVVGAEAAAPFLERAWEAATYARKNLPKRRASRASVN